MKGIISGFIGLAVLGSVVSAKAESQFPLRLDIDVSSRKESKNIGSGKDGSAKVQSVSLRVRIRRASGSAEPHRDGAEPLRVWILQDQLAAIEKHISQIED